MWVQRAVWCFSFNLPLCPDQIHEAATEDDVTIPQLSLPLSATLTQYAHMTVCVCACETLHWGQISLCLPLFNSDFVQDFGYPAHHVKSHGLDQVLSMWIRDTHKCAHTRAHTPGTPIVAAGNGMGEEWEREGKRVNAGKLLQLAYQKQSKDNNILFTQKEATRRTDRVRAPWKWSESRYRQYRTSVSFWGVCFSFILFVKLNTDLSYFSVIYLHFSVLAKTKLKGFVWNRVAKIMTNHMRFKFIYVYKRVNYTIM